MIALNAFNVVLGAPVNAQGFADAVKRGIQSSPRAQGVVSGVEKHVVETVSPQRCITTFVFPGITETVLRYHVNTQALDNIKRGTFFGFSTTVVPGLTTVVLQNWLSQRAPPELVKALFQEIDESAKPENMMFAINVERTARDVHVMPLILSTWADGTLHYDAVAHILSALYRRELKPVDAQILFPSTGWFGFANSGVQVFSTDYVELEKWARENHFSQHARCFTAPTLLQGLARRFAPNNPAAQTASGNGYSFVDYAFYDERERERERERARSAPEQLSSSSTATATAITRPLRTATV